MKTQLLGMAAIGGVLLASACARRAPEAGTVAGTPRGFFVTTETNGILKAPTNLWFANSSNMMTAIAPLLPEGVGGAVDSVFGRTGVVTAEAGDYSGIYATTGDITSAVGSHESDTTSVHGIVDTSVLLTTTSTIDDDRVSFDDGDGLWNAVTIGAALEELNDSINDGSPNGPGAKVHWSQVVGVPAGFADGTDDGTGGGSGTVTSVGMTVPTGLAVAGSPVTGFGTLALTWSGTIPNTSLDSDLQALSDNNGGSLTNLNGSNIASGTVADSRIASTIARDSEVAAAYQPIDSDLTTLATLNGAALTNLNGSSIASGTVAEARIAAAITRDSEAAAAYEPLNAGKYQATNSFLATLAGVGAATGAGNVMRTRTGVYRSFWVDAGAWRPSATNGATAGEYTNPEGVTRDVIDFADDTNEVATVSFALPAEASLSSFAVDIRYWQSSATSGTNVLLVSVGSQAPGEASVTFGSAVAVTNSVAATTNTISRVLASGVVPGGSPAAGDTLVLKIERQSDNGHDTAAGFLRAHGLRFQFQESTTEPSAFSP